MIKKKVNLLSHQYEMIISDEKFVALVAGIGAGKSHCGALYIIKRVFEYPSALHFIGANTYGQLRDSTLEAMFKVLVEIGLEYTYNQNAGLLEFAGGRVLCKSMENFDALRGIEIASFWLDEVRDLRKEAFDMMMGRLRDKRAKTLQGRVTSSPAGFNWIYDYFHSNGEKNTHEFKIITGSSYLNKYLPEGYIDSIKSQYSAEFYKQEILGEFVNIYQGQAYMNFGVQNLRIENPFWADDLVHPMLPIVVAMDFNLSPMSWCLGQKRIEDFYFFDEVRLLNSHTQEASKVLCEKLIELHPKLFKVGIILVGDATAKAGQRAAAGQSDYDIICQTLDQYKIPWQNSTPDSNPAVKDRINTMNARLKDGNGLPHLFLHPTRCPFLRKDLERVVWKPGANLVLDQTTDSELSHMSDGVGYALCALSPLKYNTSVPTLRVIRR